MNGRLYLQPHYVRIEGNDRWDTYYGANESRRLGALVEGSLLVLAPVCETVTCSLVEPW